MTAFEELRKDDFDIGDIVYVIDMTWRKFEGDYDFEYRKAKIISIAITGNVCEPNSTELNYHVDYNYSNIKDEDDMDVEWASSNRLVKTVRPLMFGGSFNIRDELIAKSLIMLENQKEHNLKKSCPGECDDCPERMNSSGISD